jgi:hypothetical protein
VGESGELFSYFITLNYPQVGCGWVVCLASPRTVEDPVSVRYPGDYVCEVRLTICMDLVGLGSV